MAVRAKTGAAKVDHQPGPPKLTRQGQGQRSKAVPGRRKKTRGQGR
jgi:hypothetical protein